MLIKSNRGWVVHQHLFIDGSSETQLSFSSGSLPFKSLSHKSILLYHPDSIGMIPPHKLNEDQFINSVMCGVDCLAQNLQESRIYKVRTTS